MLVNPNQHARPTSRTQAGVIISARWEDQDDDLLVVHVANEGVGFEALSISSPWLDAALAEPLISRTLHFVHQGELPDNPLFLVDARHDPYTDGFSHLPESACTIDGIVLGVKALVEGIDAAPLRHFLMRVFQRRDVFHHFWTMPASAKHHHSCPGGLALHSLEVASDIASHGDLSVTERDLGIAGALLHDIGKVWSYTNDMFLNTASRAMGHELVGLSRLEPELAQLEEDWPDGAYIMRCLLIGQTRMRDNGSIPTSLLPRIKACDQRSCERDRVKNARQPSGPLVWTPRPWEEDLPSIDQEVW